MSIPSINDIREITDKVATHDAPNHMFLVEYLHNCDHFGLTQVRAHIEKIIDERYVKGLDFQVQLANARAWSSVALDETPYKKGMQYIWIGQVVGLVIRAFDIHVINTNPSKIAEQTAIDAIRDYIGQDAHCTAQGLFSTGGLGILYHHPAETANDFRKFANYLIHNVDHPQCD